LAAAERRDQGSNGVRSGPRNEGDFGS